VADHNHEWFSGFGDHWYCMRSDANMQWLIIYQSPCYGKTVGETIAMPYVLDYIDGMEYTTNCEWIYLDKTVETNFDQNGLNPLVNETKFFYDNPDHALLSRTSFKDSKEQTLEVATKYPGDYDESIALWLVPLKDQHIINVPIKQETTKASNQTSGQVVVYGPKGQPKEVYNYESTTLKQPVAHSESVVIPSTDYKLKTTIAYDNISNNISTIQNVNNLPTSYIWGYQNSRLIAEVKNTNQEASSVTIAKTNSIQKNIEFSGYVATVGAPFEITATQTINPSVNVTILGTNGPPEPFLALILKRENTIIRTHNCIWGTNAFGSISLAPGIYQWYYSASVSQGGGFLGYNLNVITNYTGQKTSYKAFYSSFEEDGVLDASPKTGKKVWSGVFQLTLPAINGDYKLCYWKKPATGTWELVDQTIAITSGTAQTVNIGDATTIIDELRFFPSGAVMATYTYDLHLGVTSTTDANLITTYYEYDNFGRVALIKDSKGNPIKSFSYHYKQ
jgi:hypothetical protein